MTLPISYDTGYLVTELKETLN